MRISRKGKTRCALVLTALMALTGMSMQQTYAADGIDVDKNDCSITVSASVGKSGEYNDKYLEDFNKMEIPIDIYRVADVDVTGQKYTAVSPFEAVNLKEISSSTTADEWMEKAGEAAKKENLDKASPLTATTVSGTAKFENLTPGMYLVVPREAFNTHFTTQYTFTPYLTALPSSEYALTGAGSDEWVYDTEIGLKPEANPQFGKLNIHKILQNYNETLGQATFVFRVEAIDEDGNLLYDAENKPVYSEVISTTHAGLVEETVTLEHIPAGVTVRVTEVYSGASYETAGDTVKDVLIWSDAAAGGTIDGVVIETAEVTFENRYDGGNRGGYGVTNEFTNKDAGWEWTSGPAEEE